MIGWLGSAYPWIKAAHIIFVIFWMAGLFIFPRYLIHHQDALTRPEESAQWIDREAKLRAMILMPSMVLVWLLGLALAANVGLFDGAPHLGWLHTKLLLVVLLSAYHGWMLSYARLLAKSETRFSTRTLRMLNELPALAVIAIVVLVVVQPF